MENVLVNTRVEFYDKYPLGLRSTSKGQFILTDQRLLYLKDEHWWGGKDHSTRVDEGLQRDGSFAIPLEQVIEAKVERKLRYPYLYIRYQTATGKKPACFTLQPVGGLLSVAMAYQTGPLENIANLIDQRKMKTQSNS